MTPTQLKSMKGEFEEWIKLHSVKIVGRPSAYENYPVADTLLSPERLWQWFESKLEKVEKECDKQCEENLAKLLAQFNGMMMEDGVRDRNGEPVMFYPPKLRDFKSNKLEK